MTSSREISFYVDTLLVETVLSEPNFYKKADLESSVSAYFKSKIDPANPAASVINELAPGAVSLLFSSLGLGKWGLFAGLLMNVFHVDVYGVLKTMHDKIKDLLANGPVSKSQIDEVANSTAQEYSSTSGPQEIQEGYQYQQSQSANANDKVYSSLDLLHEAKLVRLALLSYEKENLRLVKNANWFDFSKSYPKAKAQKTNLLTKIFGWIFQIALRSAGLMVAGDVVNKLLGRPNSLDGTYQAGKPEEAPVSAEPISIQKKYPSKGDSPLPNQIPITNTPENIENVLVQFTKDTYSGLDGKEQLIKNTPGFQFVNEKFNWTNTYNPGSNTIIVPAAFISKKQLVDYFIDEVAASDNNPA